MALQLGIVRVNRYRYATQQSNSRTHLLKSHRQTFKGLDTWIRSCSRCVSTRARKMLLNEVDIYKTDVTAIQEMRCMAEEIIAYKNYTIFYSRHNEKQRFGTEFI